MPDRDDRDDGIRDERRPEGRRDDYQDDYDRPRRQRRPEPRSSGGSMAWLWVVLGVLGCCMLLCGGAMTWGYFRYQQARERMQSQNNLKWIGLACHGYHDANGKLPQDIRGRDGKPLLSWRVAILPYIEQDNLYRHFHLDEPWDSPHNKPLLSQMPHQYLMPSRQKPGDVQQGLTYYQGFAGPNTVFDPKAKFPLTLMNITDGTSNTILVAEAGEPVPWTKPADIEFDPNGPPPALKAHSGSTFNVLLCDGSVRAISPTQDNFGPKFRAAVVYNDNEGFNLD